MTGCVIAADRPRGGGGASRQGAEVTLRDADATERCRYLAWDARAGEPSRRAFFDRKTSVLQALTGPEQDAEVCAATLVGAFQSHLALLSEFVSGNERFSEALDKAVLALDFVGQPAALHQVDARHPAPGALRLCHNRTVRETAVMANAKGALATTWYEDIAA